MEVLLELLLHCLKALEDAGCKTNYKGEIVNIDKDILLDIARELKKSGNLGIATQLKAYINGKDLG